MITLKVKCLSVSCAHHDYCKVTRGKQASRETRELQVVGGDRGEGRDPRRWRHKNLCPGNVILGTE